MFPHVVRADRLERQRRYEFRVASMSPAVARGAFSCDGGDEPRGVVQVDDPLVDRVAVRELIDECVAAFQRGSAGSPTRNTSGSGLWITVGGTASWAASTAAVARTTPARSSPATAQITGRCWRSAASSVGLGSVESLDPMDAHAGRSRLLRGSLR